MKEEELASVFIGQIYDIRTKKDGGGRIQIDFGRDGLEAIQKAQALAANKNCLFNVVLVPATQSVISSTHGEEYVDPETGEVSI